MKVPLSWLNDFVDLSDLTVKQLADTITFSGIEVEGIETVGTVYSDAFVVGEILAAEKHPNADKLRVCTVTDGLHHFQIVCGAPNAAAGLKVPLAKIGAVIPEGGFQIKKAKLRGVESSGMLCSAKELGLPGGDHDGLMILDPALRPGTPLRDVLPPPETVLDLEVTWNRPDCLAIFGIAHEFSAALNRPLRVPSDELPRCAGRPVHDSLAVSVEAPDLCPRYTARLLTNVENAGTPAWMRRRLELCGVRPVSLVVDVTNYVMLETNQPLHAFDYDKLAGHKLIVRRAKKGETITTLDGVERKLAAGMLVIADAERPVAIAGVMGGADSEITPETKNIVIEGATFAAPSIKATATALGLRTEASHRFERSVDPDIGNWASRRAVVLLNECTHIMLAPGLVDADVRPEEWLNRTITLRFPRAREVIGLRLDSGTMINYLTALGLRVKDTGDNSVTFAIPTWRGDLTIEADLIEEIARLHGLDAIPENDPIALPSRLDDAPFYALSKCRRILVGFNCHEAMHYSFLSARELDQFDPAAAARRLVLPNPVSADYAVMRDALLPQLIQSTGRNAAQLPDTPVALFEIGRVFRAGKPLVEETHLAIALTGPVGRKPLDLRRPVADDEILLALKGMLEILVSRMRAGVLTLAPLDTPPAALQPGLAFTLCIDGEPAGLFGLLTPAQRHQWRLSSPVAVAELSTAPLTARANLAPPPVRPVLKFPSIRRDVAFVAPADLCHADICACIRKAAGPSLTNLTLFDIYKGKEMGVGKRSLGYAMEFRSTEKTLTDAEVNKAFTAVIDALKNQLHVELRDL